MDEKVNFVLIIVGIVFFARKEWLSFVVQELKYGPFFCSNSLL